MRVALYGRVSTPEQAEKYSLQDQLDRLVQDAQQRGDEIVRDGDGAAFLDDYTGTQTDRPAYQRLTQAVNAGLVEAIRCTAVDRFSRNARDTLNLRHDLEQLGVKLEFQSTPGLDLDSPMGFGMFGMMSVLADVERRQILERTARGRLKGAQLGKFVNPRAPYGYIYDQRAKVLAIREDEARVVQDAFEAFTTENLTTRGLAAWLNQCCVPAPKGSAGWGKSTVARLLRNEAYLGRFQQHRYRIDKRGNVRHTSLRPKAEWLPVACPPIITDEVFAAAQKRLAENAATAARNTKRFTYMLGGIMACAHCGRSIFGVPYHDSRYYRCSGKSRSVYRLGERCTCPTKKAEPVEEAIWQAMLDRLATPATILADIEARRQKPEKAAQQLATKRAELERAVKSLGEQRERILDGWRMGVLTNPVDVKAQMAKVDRQQAALQADIEALEQRQSFESLPTGSDLALVADYCRELRRQLEGATEEERKRIARWLLRDVRFGGDYIDMVMLLSNGNSCIAPKSSS